MNFVDVNFYMLNVCGPGERKLGTNSVILRHAAARQRKFTTLRRPSG